MTLSTDKTQLANQIAAAEGLSGNELKERVAILQNYSVKELTEKLQMLLNGGPKYRPSAEDDDWSYLDVQISKSSEQASPSNRTTIDKTKKQSPAPAPITEQEDLKIQTIEKIRNDAYQGLELLNSQDNGFIGNSYNTIKEYLHSQFSKSAVFLSVKSPSKW